MWFNFSSTARCTVSQRIERNGLSSLLHALCMSFWVLFYFSRFLSNSRGMQGRSCKNHYSTDQFASESNAKHRKSLMQTLDFLSNSKNPFKRSNILGAVGKFCNGILLLWSKFHKNTLFSSGNYKSIKNKFLWIWNLWNR